MKAVKFLQVGLVALSISFMTSCSKAPGSASDDGLSSHGLGQLNRFAGQEEGESYTTQAPHNQVYLFAYDDSTVAHKYIPSIQAQAEYLKNHAGSRILLAGHTDERGSREYNVALGEHRANAVAEFMRLSGVSRSQIRVVSYGKERPVYFGHDAASHKQNRRVELIFEATR